MRVLEDSLELYADADSSTWVRATAGNVSFRSQVLLEGEGDWPEALRISIDDTPSVFAHMHLTSQFQLLLRGRMNMARGSAMQLRPLAVHYTDHNVPYGPFSAAEKHEMLVLHPKVGGLAQLTDVAWRREINLGGRLRVCNECDAKVSHVMRDGIRSITDLLPAESGPSAMVVDTFPDCQLNTGAAPFGRYEVVVSGSIHHQGKLLHPPSLRYVIGNAAMPLRIGPDGARIALLTFDDDALVGGAPPGLREDPSVITHAI